MLDLILWWTGAVTWCVLSMIGALWLFDQFSDWLIGQMWSRKELYAFVADRLRRGKQSKA